MAIGPRFPHRVPENYNIPKEWQHLVCLCPDENGTKHCDECIYMHCRKCEKFKRFYVSRCSKCREFYLMVFKHEDWAPKINLCLNCLGPEGLTIPPPEWVKPKPPKTKEEIEADLDAFFNVVDSTGSVGFDF